LLNGAESSVEERIWHHRNLGKAFYENPATQIQAVDEFKKALDLAPSSVRERINYGLALLRAGKTKEGVAELEKAQKQDPKVPHTWFNLGIVFKKESEYEKAAAQLEQMIKLAPDEPVSHYNLAVLHKLAGRAEAALKHFEISSKLDPNLAGPHFQLYNAYRAASRPADAQRELQIFQEIKKRTAGAAVPEDMEWSYYSEIYDPIDPRPAEQLPAELRFKRVALPGKLDPKTAGLALLEVEGRADAIGWSANGVPAGPAERIGLAGLKGILAMVPGDFDNDGLADLCILTDSGAALYLNRQGRFEKSPVQLPAGRFESAVWMDYDHDYDLDLVLLGEKSALARNNGAAGFSDLSASFPFVKGRATSGAIFELIADTNGTDLVVTYADRPAVLYVDKLAGKYVAQPIDAFPAGSTSVVAQDVDNDGWMDLAAATPGGVVIAGNRRGKLAAAATLGQARGPLAFADLENRGVTDLIAAGAVYRNQGLGRFAPAKSPLPEAVALAAADVTGDGRTDVVLVGTDGTVQIFDNQTVTKNTWIRIALAGVKNLKLAPAAEVEVKAGALYQKRLYHGFPLAFGLGPYQQVDTLRITWPNGLIQNEPKQPAGKSAAYKEAQRLSGSCPMIFTWNGREFEFITDVLGVAPLGASSGDGSYFPVDHDEWVEIPGDSLKMVGGRYEVRITEELREVSYLDQIRLFALDHPAGVDVFTNDKFKSPPFPEFRLFGVTQRIRPVSARDHHGRDVRDRLLARDRAYPDGFRRDYAGVAERHHLDLDFGSAAADNGALLVLSGWVDWADGSTFRGVAQESKDGLILPYLQVKDAAGNWRTVIEDMGIPAGKPKTMVVDLTGKFLSAWREVRIVTNLCIYWDEIFLSEDTAAPRARLTPLETSAAELRYRGFSRPVIHPERRQPESFDYQSWMPVSMWNPTPGLYTRYGGVRALLGAVDDQMVIMGSGDELRLSFEARGLPALPAGWKRDFLLYVDGWAKDGDANTAYSQSVEPLPFHRMSRYPYTENEKFPETELQRRLTTRPALRLLRPLAENRERGEAVPQ